MLRASSFITKSERRTIRRKSRRVVALCATPRTTTPISRNGTEPNGLRTRKRTRSGEADAGEGKAPGATHQELDADLLSRARRGRGRGHRRVELDGEASRGARREPVRQHAAQGAVER